MKLWAWIRGLGRAPAEPSTPLLYQPARTWTDSFGQTIYNVHSPAKCAGEYCTIHNPSDHSMRDRPILWRSDRGMLLERICAHNVGHPDPDCLAWLERMGVEGEGVHGCDGCCA